MADLGSGGPRRHGPEGPGPLAGGPIEPLRPRQRAESARGHAAGPGTQAGRSSPPTSPARHSGHARRAGWLTQGRLAGPRSTRQRIRCEVALRRPMAGCGPTQPALAAAPANPDCHGPGPGARRERLDGAPLAAYRAAPGRPTGQALVRLARGGGGPHRVPLTHAARRGAAVSGTLDGCPPIRVTVTTDARTAELLRDAGLKPVEIPELDEGILNPLVAEYETTIFSTATLEPLSRARRLALELRRRGSRPRMVRCDGWSGTLAELVTTDAGRAEVRQLIADAPLCEFPEMEDEPGST